MGVADELAAKLLARPGFALEGFDPDALADELDAETLELLYAQIAAEDQAQRYAGLDKFFADGGPLAWSRYTKHMEHFEAGKLYRERCFMAGNRVGKTIAGGFEVTCHLTGRYKDWWPGRRMRRANRWWVAGDTNETTRDILQLELLGEIGFRQNRKTFDGTGLVPRDCIGDVTWKQGVQNLVDTIEIQHRTGGSSLLGFKSFDQGRRAFQGTAKEGIWLDEEAPEDVYGECLIRTATTRGMLITTFTPLRGLSKVVLSFLPKDMRPGDH